jgi:cyclophilin family peptidyl-prolyl cis-trans isomerase
LRDGKDVDPARDLDALGRALIAPEAAVRAAVTDAIAESKRPGARPLLLRELGDAEPLARARAARGLIGLLHVEDVGPIAAAIGDDDERVAAAAAQALATLGEQGNAPAIVALTRAVPLLARPAVLVALVDQQALRRAELAPVFAAVYRQVSADPALACTAAVGHDRTAARVELVKGCVGVDEAERRRLVARVLAECDPALSLGAVDALLGMPGDDALLRELVAAALGRYDDPRARRRVVQLLDDPDLVVRATAAETVAAHGWDDAGAALLRALAGATTDGHVRPDDVDPVLSLVAATGVLHPAGAAAVLRPLLVGTPGALALAAREALTRLGEHDLAHPAIPHGPHDELALPEGPVRVRLETNRGAIVIELDPARAPRNARNFLGLVRAGFYDGLRFHRIVPGFVAQGGDPRGDGTGGAGHEVACEPNPTPYVEGTVGMALSGPDTGSSQFFIALAPAPHLEGRYTAFGRVVAGMEVARALITRDRIVRAREER